MLFLLSIKGIGRCFSFDHTWMIHVSHELIFDGIDFATMPIACCWSKIYDHFWPCSDQTLSSIWLWAMLKYFAITLDLSGFRNWASLKSWTGTHCAHLISCYSLVFQSVCLRMLSHSVLFISDICVSFSAKAHGKQRGPSFLRDSNQNL